MAVMKALSGRSGGTPVAGNTGSPAGGGAQEEREIPQRKPEVLVK